MPLEDSLSAEQQLLPWSLAKASLIANAAHARTGVLDPVTSAPYIAHPARVLAAMHRDGHSERRLRLAILHDTLEDTDLTADDLRAAGMPEDELTDLLRLTKKPGEPLDDAMDRVTESDDATAVKFYDVADNVSRLDALALVDAERAGRLVTKYARSRERLGRRMPDPSRSD